MKTRSEGVGRAAGVLVAALFLVPLSPAAADVVIQPERAAIQVAADPATYVRAAWFGAADTEETTLGFSDSSFSHQDPFFGFDDVWALQNPQ